MKRSEILHARQEVLRNAGYSDTEARRMSESAKDIENALGVSPSQRRGLESIGNAFQRMVGSYDKESIAYRLNRVDPDNARTRGEQLIQQFTFNPNTVTPENVQKFIEASRQGMPMRGESKTHGADPAYQLWTYDFDQYPDDMDGYGIYE